MVNGGKWTTTDVGDGVVDSVGWGENDVGGEGDGGGEYGGGEYGGGCGVGRPSQPLPRSSGSPIPKSSENIGW